MLPTVEEMREQLADPIKMQAWVNKTNQEQAVVDACKTMFKEQGRDFDAEFKAWKEPK